MRTNKMAQMYIYWHRRAFWVWFQMDKDQLFHKRTLDPRLNQHISIFLEKTFMNGLSNGEDPTCSIGVDDILTFHFV